MLATIAILLAVLPGPHAYKQDKDSYEQRKEYGQVELGERRCSQSLVTGKVLQRLPGNEYPISSAGWKGNTQLEGPVEGYSSAILRRTTGRFGSPGWFTICEKNEKSPDREVTLENGFSEKLHVYEEWHR